jgi:hypothetical protein
VFAATVMGPEQKGGEEFAKRDKNKSAAGFPAALCDWLLL